jgi:hypothetical protein
MKHSQQYSSNKFGGIADAMARLRIRDANQASHETPFQLAGSFIRPNLSLSFM